MVKALEDLRDEHRLIERVLAVLEGVAQQPERGDEVSPDTLEQAVKFVRGFADGCHHAKEEQGLFPLLAAKNPTIEFGPVRVLTADHEAGRELMRALERGIELMRKGEPEGVVEVGRALTLYTHMLRRHIAKEEDILFPLSEGLLTEEDAESLDRHFEHVEERAGEGAHERYELLVRELESALSVGNPRP